MDRRQFQSIISWKKNQWFDELFKRNYEPSSNEENTTFEPADKSICESKVTMVQEQREFMYETGMETIR